MKKKKYIQVELIRKNPLSEQEKIAKLYQLAEKLKVKIGNDNVKKGK